MAQQIDSSVRAATRLSLALAVVFVLFQTSTAASAQAGTVTLQQCIDNGLLCAHVDYNADCQGWQISSVGYSNNGPTYQVWNDLPPAAWSGSWTDPSVLESAHLGYSIYLYDVTLDYYFWHTFVFVVPEPPNCLSVACEQQYFMYTMEDAEQPTGWQRFCYIISRNGPPSVEAQARVCSVPGFEHVFRATNSPYAGWVSTCNGRAYYGWPAWDPAWYRPEFAGRGS
jgi:hypothetical protein